MKKSIFWSLFAGLLISSMAFASRNIDPIQDCNVNYKNLSSGDKRALNQKIKSCGCPTDIEEIVE